LGWVCVFAGPRAVRCSGCCAFRSRSGSRVLFSVRAWPPAPAALAFFLRFCGAPGAPRRPFFRRPFSPSVSLWAPSVALLCPPCASAPPCARGAAPWPLSVSGVPRRFVALSLLAPLFRPPARACPRRAPCFSRSAPALSLVSFLFWRPRFWCGGCARFSRRCGPCARPFRLALPVSGSARLIKDGHLDQRWPS
jgi:hypothetical protein